MLFSFAKSSAIPRFALFLIVSATFPLAILGLEENSELLEVEKERHSFGRHRHEEGDAENGHKGLALDFPEQLTISIGGSGKIQFKYSGILDAELRLSFSYNGTILKVEPPEILLPRGENSTTELTVTGLALSSRTFIDLANCTFGNGTQKCPFEKEEVFVRVVVVKSRLISVLVIISGWIYFLAWSISFYPQIILNCQRKSVVGLNFDFLVLNIIGFACYTIYNVLLYFDENVQDIYIARHGHRSLIPVLLNDVVFASHALLACIITGFQCFIYERGNQRISYTCRAWASSVLLCFCFLSLFLTLLHVLNWLDFINYLAYGKMAVTLSKYFPQAILNFRRKSTVGWSIGNVLLDFFGGSMDICQMILQATNTNDWSAFTGNPVKFGLGFVSIIFDILFMIQHYILYPHKVYTELSTYDQVSDEREPPLSPPTRTITLQNNQRNDETEPVVFP